VKVGQYYAEGLQVTTPTDVTLPHMMSHNQTFTPEAGRYDVIWCQWVLAHLTDGQYLVIQ